MTTSDGGGGVLTLSSRRPSLVGARDRSALGRVEIAGGVCRTGTALACLAILDRLPASEAVAYVRAGYRPNEVQTPGQRRLVARFTGTPLMISIRVGLGRRFGRDHPRPESTP